MPDISLKTVDQRIPPVRGLVLASNANGVPFDLVDVKRWLQLCHEVFKSEKVDVFQRGEAPLRISALQENADRLQMRLSLRTDCISPPDSAGDLLSDLGLLDVFLSPTSADTRYLSSWFEACAKTELPVRLQIPAPFPSSFNPSAFVAAARGARVVSLNIVLHDPFIPPYSGRDPAESRETIRRMNALATEAAAQGIETNLLHLPLCLVSEENLALAGNWPLFFFDHQQYQKAAYEFAVKVFKRNPNAMGKIVIAMLGRNTAYTSFIDARLLPWLLEGPRRHFWSVVWRRLTRKLNAIRGYPRPLEESESAYEREIRRLQDEAGRKLGPRCAGCCLRRICNHENREFKRVLPGVPVNPRSGEIVASPWHFAARQPKYYDDVDAARVTPDASYLKIAERAKGIVTNVLPTREVQSEDYEIEGQWTHHMPGGNRWYSFSNVEKLSTVLTRTAPPLTIAVTLGGGIAEYAGFSFGRHSKLVVPMESYSHQLVCHIEADGHYALLRDGHPVKPIEFEGVQYVPTRLGGILEPRISLWNIDHTIVTQTVLLWEGGANEAAQLARIKYSVVIISTRFSRRLQAVLLSLAHQRGFDLSTLEVIVAYVPGIDATDDLIDTLRLTFPGLRIVRAPFTENYARSKGFLINESVQLASGEWITLLDSDILVGPDTFARIEAVSDRYVYIAADGRKMLTPKTTAGILVGEILPWQAWEDLLKGEGEFREREAQGVPIGFFQCFRRTCFERVKYVELDHFEGADWRFGNDLRNAFGIEHRLEGIPVLHLDHGGSQWYGTQKQR